MTATGAHMNIKSAVFVAGTTYTLTKVSDADYDGGLSTKKLSGDGNRFPTVSINDFGDPVINVSAGNITPLLSAPDGVEGTLTVVISDAINTAGGAGSGELSIVMSQAKIEDIKVTAKHREYATGTVKFGCRSTDGTTNPVVCTFA